MPTTTGYEFGVVVLVPYPFTDQRATKHRPAVVAVTSQVRAEPAIGEAAIAKWKEAGLLKPSVLKPLLATIEKALVLRRLGRLEDKDGRALRGCSTRSSGADHPYVVWSDMRFSCSRGSQAGGGFCPTLAYGMPESTHRRRHC